MSSHLLIPSSRSGLRTCRVRRFYSSAATDTPQPKAQHAPMASDFGGIEIGPRPPRTGNQRRGNAPTQRYATTGPVRVSEFREGSVAQRLAKSKVQKEKSTETTTAGNQKTPPGRWSRTPISVADAPRLAHDLDELEGKQVDERLQSRPQPSEVTRPATQARGLYEPDRRQSGRPDMERRQSGRPDADTRQPGRPDADQMQIRRDPRRGRGSAPQRRRQEPSRQDTTRANAFETEADYDENEENDAVATPFVLRRPDPPLPPPTPILPPSLTALETRVDIDGPTCGVHEHQGGDYTRHFSPEEWKLVHAQSVAPLRVVDYARLALSLNASVDAKEKRLGAQLVRKNVGKAEVATAL